MLKWEKSGALGSEKYTARGYDWHDSKPLSGALTQPFLQYEYDPCFGSLKVTLIMESIPRTGYATHTPLHAAGRWGVTHDDFEMMAETVDRCFQDYQKTNANFIIRLVSNFREYQTLKTTFVKLELDESNFIMMTEQMFASFDRARYPEAKPPHAVRGGRPSWHQEGNVVYLSFNRVASSTSKTGERQRWEAIANGVIKDESAIKRVHVHKLYKDFQMT